MIVPFAVDPEALLDMTGDMIARRRAHRQLVRVWGKYGALVYHNGPGSPFLQQVDAISDQEVRKTWQGAILQNRTSEAEGANWPDLGHAETAEAVGPLKDFVRLACVDAVRASLLGVPDGDIAIDLEDGSLEVCHFNEADRANSFLQADELSDAAIEEGMSTDAVWDERFHGFARFSRQVVIVDAYCLTRHIRALDDGHGELSGLRRLLTELDKTAKPHYVTLFTTVDRDGEWDESRAEEVLASEWNRMARGGVHGLKLHLSLNPNGFGKVAHDRYVRFDRTIVNLGQGLEILEGKRVDRRCQFSLEQCDGPTKVEIRLLGLTMEFAHRRAS